MVSGDRARSHKLIIAGSLGLGVGFLSGLFGVGGGSILVPLLVLVLNFDQRRAAGTSLASIVPSASVGVIFYATHDSVAWIPALILAAGAVVGAQVGAWLLPRVSQVALRWGFVVFLLAVVVSLFVVIPVRDAPLPLTLLSGIGLVLTGLVTGVLAGLLGVGGGIIVVPALMMVFGASDLVAKGTSMLMMIPTAISGTLGNLKRRNVDLPIAVAMGVAASLTTALGAWFASVVNPATGNILFAIFLLFIAAQMIFRAWRGRGKRKARG